MTTEIGSNGVADFYFCDLPATERNDLCKLLDEQSSWQELADKMKFSEFEIQVECCHYEYRICFIFTLSLNFNYRTYEERPNSPTQQSPKFCSPFGVLK